MDDFTAHVLKQYSKEVDEFLSWARQCRCRRPSCEHCEAVLLECRLVTEDFREFQAAMKARGIELPAIEP